MPKRVAVLLTLMLLALAGFAQNRSNIKGKVIDSLTKAPMEFATIAVVNLTDTTSVLPWFTVTDKTGAFALHNLPSGIPLKVLITFVAYKPYRKFITLTKDATVGVGTIVLNPKNLNEVSINGARAPIVINKDTIEFNTEAFKTRPNAVVEELLKLLPGVEVDNDGTLKAMGKMVSKVLVDGHEFFVSDPRIASQNIDADMIDKVQVYDDYDNDPDHIQPKSKVKKIINLKFKKALKKSIFGKVYAGAGTIAVNLRIF